MRVRSGLRFSAVVHFRALRVLKSAAGSGDDLREHVAKGYGIRDYFVENHHFCYRRCVEKIIGEAADQRFSVDMVSQ